MHPRQHRETHREREPAEIDHQRSQRTEQPAKRGHPAQGGNGRAQRSPPFRQPGTDRRHHGEVARDVKFAATAVAIKLEDRGPLFFRQQRVGLRGRLFGMWKFRSMVVNAEKLKESLAAQNEMQGGVTFKMKNDPRVTRVGRFTRKYSIDELPQFWNVFRGEMSLVGPRPPVPREVAIYTPEDRQRLLARPGLTCFWQVGGRSAIDFAGQVRLDVSYIQSSSCWLDLKLLVQTVPAVLFGKGAF